jgi:D-aminoacyl-tRNA deacylase
MRALVQRVSEASVAVDGETVGSIGPGLLILLGVHQNDDLAVMDWIARKCAALRIFPDEEGRMNRAIGDVGGDLLVVSQFTLYGDTSRGNRPSFTASAAHEKGNELYQAFVDHLRSVSGRRVETGVFGAMMSVRLVNDGPVTLLVERERTP